MADALSRLPVETHEGEVTMITSTSPAWLADVIKSYEGDKETQEIISGLLGNTPNYSAYQYSKGLIRTQGRIYVGTGGNVKESILWELHDSPAGGHSGQEVTLKRVAQFFY